MRHTHLGWDGGFGGLTTHPLPDGARLGLRIADLTLAILGDGTDDLALDGRADAEVRRWLGGQLRGARPRCRLRSTRRSLTRCRWHVIAIGARYSLDELADSFATLAAWFANAHDALGPCTTSSPRES